MPTDLALLEGTKGSDVFKMLKERNSFDRNFPTLNTRTSSKLPNRVPPSNHLHLQKPQEEKIIQQETASTASAWQKQRLNEKQIEETTIVPSHNNLSSNTITTTTTTANSPPTLNLPPTGNPSNVVNNTNNPPQITTTLPNSPVIPTLNVPTTPVPNSSNNGINNLEQLKVLVPATAPPKVLNRNRVELVKKGRPELPRTKKMSPLLLRKASSEPLLPSLPYEENYIQLMNGSKKPTEEKSKPTPTNNRNWFYQGLIKREAQKRKGQEELKPTEVTCGSNNSDEIQKIEPDKLELTTMLSENVSPSVESNDLRSSGTNNNNNNNNSNNNNNDKSQTLQPKLANEVQKTSQIIEEIKFVDQNVSLRQIDSNITNKDGSTPFDKEDEERLLRKLGWLPEEEEHVPALTEEEILEVVNKFNSLQQLRKANTVKNGYHPKKWQHGALSLSVPISQV